MGHPKRIRKIYETPRHPWKKARIDRDKKLVKDFGLKNRKEVWKAESLLRKYSTSAKRLVNPVSEHEKKEVKEIINRLKKLDLIKENLNEVLNLKIEDVMARRLQSLVFRKGLARSMNQARQFTIHGHICIGEEKVTVPSYLVSKDEEGKITFLPKSKLASSEHPERLIKETKIEKKKEKKEEKQEKKEVKSKRKKKDEK